ncbi:MAG TPA: cyanophycinase [Thermoanaerobaculia bacterium]|jgi:cyanophycinase|nr:cyanophycinase [Thermoanaerobaculia bacterium]
MGKKKQGTLIIIGGAEKKDPERKILKEVARQANGGKLVVATVATEEPEEVWKEYRKIFQEIGVTKIDHLDVRIREEATSEDRVKILKGAKVVFFTGGDQLKITSQLGDSAVYQTVEKIFQEGGTVAGTSAGASVMSETMLVTGDAEQSHQIGKMLAMAPGLGFIQDVVVDQHFAERGRLSRLLGAIAQNPRYMGMGIDENTAVVVRGDSLEVLGSGAVYVLDGSGSTYSNLAEKDEDLDKTMAVFDVKLHVLSEGNRFNLVERRPELPPKPEEVAASRGAKTT